MEVNVECNTECNSEETTNTYPLVVEKFDFLDICLKQSKVEFGLNVDQIGVTCFDVNDNYFIFGTNYGIIYCFRRHVFNCQQLSKYRLISSSIRIIQLITDELMTFATESGVYLLNRLNRKFLYGWKCPTKAKITSFQAYLSVKDQKLVLISGDSDGFVRFHDLTNSFRGQQNIIYKDFGFPIIQIEFIDSQTLLISSSLKTVIIKIDFSDPNQQKWTQIGQKERKTVGKFGAVYSHKSGLIYGSRPSLHLIKAKPNGEVIETIRINNIEESECPQQLQPFRQKSTAMGGRVQHKLGVLKLFCDDQYVLSVNDSNLLIIRTDGQFCMKEKIEKLIDVKMSTTNTREAFLLLESKQVIRIRDKNSFTSESDFEVSSDFECSSESEDKTSDSKSSNESLINLLRAPVAINPISFIDEELKKAFDFKKLQKSLTEKYNQLSTSIITTIDPQILPNCDKNVFVESDYVESIYETKDSISEVMSPLVITRKGKRKTPNNTNDSNLTNKANNCAINGSEESDTNSSDISEHLTQNSLSKVEVCNKTTENMLETTDTSDDNRLLMILSSYKEANNKIVSNLSDSETQNIENIELLTETSHITNENESKVQQILSSDNCDLFSLEENKSQKVFEQLETELKETEKSGKVSVVEFEWEKMITLSEIKSIKTFEFISFCATGYNSSSEIGLIWFVLKNTNYLRYFPSFDSLKLSKVGAIKATCAATYELYVLSDSGAIFKREGMDATKPIGTKWTQIKTNKSKCKLTSISLNTKSGILWCCDQNGETWTHQMRGQKWSLINDFSSHSIEMKKVFVSPFDSSIVWGIDRIGKIFVRNFHKSGDNKLNDICGEEWLLIDGILAEDIVVCCDNNVWITDRHNQLFRRSAQIISNDSSNEWQSIIGPKICEDDSFESLSVTENNDIWLMTRKGLVWHSFTQSKRNSTPVDLDWLLI